MPYFFFIIFNHWLIAQKIFGRGNQEKTQTQKQDQLSKKYGEALVVIINSSIPTILLWELLNPLKGVW